MNLTTNQWWAFVLGLAAAVAYWFQLLLLTQTKISVKFDQYMGLLFAIAIAVIGWLRFVFTTSGSLKN